MDAHGVVIVGASLSGLTTAEALRSEGYGGPITLVGEEEHLPYHRPPLSKQVLADRDATTDTRMRDTAQLDGLGVRLLRGERATAVDLLSHEVTVGTETLRYDSLVIATGVTARRLPMARGLTGIHALRTLDDSAGLADDLLGAGRVVVVGAGVLGCEIAAAARTAGHDVMLLGRSREPGVSLTGGHLSSMIGAVLRENGVRMKMGVEVTEAIGRGAVSALRLSDGSVVPADVVVTAIGCDPAVDWLRGSTLDLTDGVLCDESGRAAPDVYAIGDVARWASPTGDAVRVEHQATAIEQALAVAHLLVTGETSPPILPFFWSELFDARILVQGTLAPELPLTVLAGKLGERRFVAATLRGGHTTGIIGWNMPRDFRIERARMIEEFHLTPRNETTPVKESIVS